MVEYKWVALSNTTLGTLMASLDGNIVLIALPTIGRELADTSLFDLLWILLGYQLVTASVLVNFGRLADMFGRVKLYNFGFAIFTLGSALCSVSQTSQQLITLRLVQAIGAGFLYSNSAAILRDAFPEKETGRALGINQAAIVAGSLLGLVLGGFLTATAGWRSIFWVNIPIGLFATIWSHRELRELEAKQKEHESVDVAGNLTFAGGLALVLLGATLYPLEMVTATAGLSLVSGGLLLVALFFFIERRAKYPMLDVSLFRIRLFTAGNAAIFLNALARGVVTLVLVFYLQGPTMGLDPLAAGVFLIPVSLFLGIFAPLSGSLSYRYDPRILPTLGLVVSAVGFILLGTLGPTTTFLQLALPLALVGGGMGIFASPNRASIMNSVPADRRGIASGVSTTLTNVGSTFSLAIAFLTMTTIVPIGDLEQIFLGSSRSLGNAPWIGSFITSIHSVYYLSTIFLLIAIVPSLERGRSPSKDPDRRPEGS